LNQQQARCLRRTSPTHFPQNKKASAITLGGNKSDRDNSEILQQEWQQIRQYCQQFGGQVLQSGDDGLLFSFESVEIAVNSAIKIQKALAIAAASLLEPEWLLHRIGIHLGQVFFTDNDVIGSGVDFVTQLYAQALPGGICLSQAAYDRVKNHLPVNVVNLGQHHLTTHIPHFKSSIKNYRVILRYT
jgi:class 3 adenylate cyclase